MPENNQILSVAGQLVGMPLAGPESFSQQQLDYLKRALGVDETVLYENANGAVLYNGVTLSESRLNFERLRITYAIQTDGAPAILEIPMIGVNRGASFIHGLVGSIDNHSTSTAGYVLFWNVFFSGCTDTVLKSSDSKFIGKTGFINGSTPGTWTQGSNASVPVVYKVVGIHRVSGGN